MASNALQQLQKSALVKVVGVVAVLAVVGVFVAPKFMPHGASNDVPVAQVKHPAPHLTSAAPHAAPNAPVAAKAAPAAVKMGPAFTPGAVNAAPAAAGPRGLAQTVAPASHPAAGEGSSAPVVTAVTTTAVPVPSHMDEHLTYQYNALGRRDPFQSLVDGQFVGADVGGDAPPDPGGIKVVGIVWGATDQFALVEDVRGNSFVLRKGDKVQNGFVEGLKRDGVIVNITAEGQSQSVVIPLTRKGDQNAR